MYTLVSNGKQVLKELRRSSISWSMKWVSTKSDSLILPVSESSQSAKKVLLESFVLQFNTQWTMTRIVLRLFTKVTS